MATDLLTVPAADLPATIPETPAPTRHSRSAYWLAIIPMAAAVVWTALDEPVRAAGMWANAAAMIGLAVWVKLNNPA